jgi:integrase
MGTIYRQTGRTIWMLKYFKDGRAFYESSETDSREAAKKKLQSIEGKVADGRHMSGVAHRMRFEDAATDIENEYQANGRKSIDHLKRRLKLHLKPFFDRKRFSKITSADVNAYVAERLAAGAANAEINRELAILKRMYSLALQAGKVFHKPHIAMLKEDNVRKGFFEPAQFESVRKRLPVELRPLVTIGYWTGWRVQSELLPLQWRQVDEDRKTLRLEPGTTKNTEGRTFPYAKLPDVVAAMQTCRHATDAAKRKGTITPYVFHRDGRPIRDFRQAWQDACAAAGVRGKIVHDFRRTAVRNLVRAGVSEKTAMMLTGHKTRSVFDRYDIVDEADLTTAVGRLQDAMVSAKVSASSSVKKPRSHK